MANLSKITLPNNVTYNLADSAARESLNGKQDIYLSGQVDDSSEAGYITPSQVFSALNAGRNVSASHFDSTFGVLTFTAWNIASTAGIVVSNSLLEYNNNLVSYTLVGNGGEWSSSFAVILTDVDAGRIDAVLEEKAASDGSSTLYAAKRTASIPYAQVDSTSTATVFTATVPEITELRDGVCVLLKNGVVTSAANFTININNLGAKPAYTSLAAATRESTIFNVAYTMLFVYDTTRVSGGCWICYRGSDANTNTIGYQLRTNSSRLPSADQTGRYRLLFTSADNTHWVPGNTSDSTAATGTKTVNQRPIDPFGPIIYYGYTSVIAAGSMPGAAYMWQQYVVTLGYTFTPITLNDFAPLYLKCTPQANGSAIINSTAPVVQTLPSTNDGFIYIYLGIATSTTAFELSAEHPVLYHDGTGVRLWTGKEIPTGLPTVSSTDNGKILQVVNGTWTATSLPTYNGEVT